MKSLEEVQEEVLDFYERVRLLCTEPEHHAHQVRRKNIYSLSYIQQQDATALGIVQSRRCKLITDPSEIAKKIEEALGDDLAEKLFDFNSFTDIEGRDIYVKSYEGGQGLLVLNDRGRQTFNVYSQRLIRNTLCKVKYDIRNRQRQIDVLDLSIESQLSQKDIETIARISKQLLIWGTSSSAIFNNI